MEHKTHSPREVFLHLLAIVTLYMSAFNFGRLIFYYVERFFPDILEQGHYAPPRYYANQSMRWSIAALIVVFPVYYFVTRFLRRLYARDPSQATRRIRKWLVYLTLFLAAVAIIVDLVTLVHRFLGGELTVRFALKVITVLLIAGAIFGYYFWELRQFGEEKRALGAQQAMWFKVFVGAIVVAIAVVVVGGFFIVGSPTQERLARFDEQRVNDLQIIQNELVSFWQTKNKLPATLDELKNDITGFVPPQDPVRKAAYEYRAVKPLQFELCATFATSNKSAPENGPTPAAPYPPGAYPYDTWGNWSHELGRVCFTRTIDPQRLGLPARKD